MVHHVALFLCLARLPAGQSDDSISAARRIVAAASLAAQEYAAGVAPGGGRVINPDEVAEAKLFLDQARFDTPLLPEAVRSYSDHALVELGALVERTAPPGELERLVAALRTRLAAAVGDALIPAPSHPPSLSRGAVVYREQCAACHGESGRGDGPKAKSLSGPPPPSLVDPAVVGSLSLVDVYRRITIGVAGTAMPEFEASLTEDDRWAVTAYVASLSTGGPSAAVREALRAAAVFVAVRRQLDSAVALRSESIVFDAYLSFEQVETSVRARDAALASRLEAGFFKLRQGAAGGANAVELRAIHRELLGDLEHAERVVTERASGTTLFVPSLFLLVREGFEAIVIIAALMTFLAKAGAPERQRQVGIGAATAVGASAVTAVLFELLLENAPGPRAALEGITMLVATAVLFSVSYWLLSKIEADKWSAFLKTKLRVALASGSGAALASVAFLAVYREGVETILFYRALLLSGGDGAVSSVAAGAALGAVVLVLLYVAMTRLGLRIPMKPFFAVTGVLLYAMAFVFAGKGVAELQEGRIVATTVMPSVQWLRVPALGIYPTVQSLGLQAVLVVLALVAAMAALRPRDSKTPVTGARVRS